MQKIAPNIVCTITMHLLIGSVYACHAKTSPTEITAVQIAGSTIQITHFKKLYVLSENLIIGSSYYFMPTE